MKHEKARHMRISKQWVAMGAAAMMAMAMGVTALAEEPVPPAQTEQPAIEQAAPQLQQGNPLPDSSAPEENAGDQQTGVCPCCGQQMPQGMTDLMPNQRGGMFGRQKPGYMNGEQETQGRMGGRRQMRGGKTGRWQTQRGLNSQQQTPGAADGQTQPAPNGMENNQMPTAPDAANGQMPSGN